MLIEFSGLLARKSSKRHLPLAYLFMPTPGSHPLRGRSQQTAVHMSRVSRPASSLHHMSRVSRQIFPPYNHNPLPSPPPSSLTHSPLHPTYLHQPTFPCLSILPSPYLRLSPTSAPVPQSFISFANRLYSLPPQVNHPSPSDSLCADAFAIAHHAVQDRSLGPDACIHAFALTRCLRHRLRCVQDRLQSQDQDCSPKTVALAPSSLHAMSRLQRCADAFAIAHHAVQDRSLGPDSEGVI